jgi:ferric-dicitrate binding protein FerR (iron transport regulator)
MDFIKYSTYTIQNFLDDDDFIQWVINPDAKSDNFWNLFLIQYPHQESALLSSAAVIKSYRKQNVFHNEGHQQLVWNRIEATIANGKQKQSKIFSFPVFMRIAAVLLLISSIGGVFWYYNTKQVLTTAFGEVKTITLPDQSVVVLNGNSTISYTRRWGNTPREIWIKGEALFKVKHLNKDTLHIKPSEKFVVHCNDLSIEVLGTTFNVKNRRDQTSVGLITGKVRLDYLDSTDINHQFLVMKPGDYIKYLPKHNISKVKLNNPEKLSQWTNRNLVFSNPTLKDILEMLEDNYGYHITLSNPDMASARIEGEINVPNVDELFETISTTLHFKIKQFEKNITITDN